MLRNVTLALSILALLALSTAACDKGSGDGGGEPSLDTEIVEEDLAPVCEPQCEGRECGYDGCGGSCGECEGNNSTCVAGQCECKPQCGVMVCGDDGCGGSCGACPDGETCDDGACVCAPDCEDKECGPDGCGGFCGACEFGSCIGGVCYCQAECFGKECGPDNCGGDCGTCGCGYECNPAGTCIYDACDGKQCGDDGCGGSCGDCGCGEECVDGGCVFKACYNKDCGDDGCGGICGMCMGDQDLCVEGLCVCTPDCAGKNCGPDGCGGSCGACDAGACSELGTCASTCAPLGKISCFKPLQGDTSVGWNTYTQYACSVWDDSGPEVSYLFTPTFSGPISITVSDYEGFDPDIFLLEGGCSDAACVGKGDVSIGTEVVAGETYYVVVDGYNLSQGTYSIEVICDCDPDCTDKACGDDGCGGECGPCPGAQDACVDFACVCQPTCLTADGAVKECGSDGCEDSCGECTGPQDLCVDGFCACQPACVGAPCGGDDGCGGICDGYCPGVQDACVEGVCTCQPSCADAACGGDDGCDGLCDGPCEGEGEVCFDAACCVPECPEDALCGDDDGCGGGCPGPCFDCEYLICDSGACVCAFPCGDVGECCGVHEECVDGFCESVVCVPDCADKLCGDDDGCGYECAGPCPDEDMACFDCLPGPECICDTVMCQDDCCPSADAVCFDGLCCAPSCSEEAVCGDDDGCGGLCQGTCEMVGQVCTEGVCACEFALCDDVCCGEGQACFGGACCVPDCANAWCGGDDGCGGLCQGPCDSPFMVCDEEASCLCEFVECPDFGCCPEGALCTPDCCVPVCAEDALCGDGDGCGGVCDGPCLDPEDHVCVEGACCEPDCGGKFCGDEDGCGGECMGPCPDCWTHTCVAETCQCNGIVCFGECCAPDQDCVDGVCAFLCEPDCTDKYCGEDDGCGNPCFGPCVEGVSVCDACFPGPVCECLFTPCGDGCCAAGEVCTGALECCVPDCAGKLCGADDGCGGLCDGLCLDCTERTCEAGACVCIPPAFEMDDGTCCAGALMPDGSCCPGGIMDDGSCCQAGFHDGVCCGDPYEIFVDGECQPGCEPMCQGAACGLPDGCGGLCQGDCPDADQICCDGQCECPFEACAWDACCVAGEECLDGVCAPIDE